jgi:hypothetical protein
MELSRLVLHYIIELLPLAVSPHLLQSVFIMGQQRVHCQVGVWLTLLLLLLLLLLPPPLLLPPLLLLLLLLLLQHQQRSGVGNSCRRHSSRRVRRLITALAIAPEFQEFMVEGVGRGSSSTPLGPRGPRTLGTTRRPTCRRRLAAPRRHCQSARAMQPENSPT